jgi:hypothetical protein
MLSGHTSFFTHFIFSMFQTMATDDAAAILSNVDNKIAKCLRKIRHYQGASPAKVGQYSLSLEANQKLRRQLLEVVNAKKWTKVPAGLDNIIQYKFGTQEGPLRQMLARFEAELELHGFPEKEGATNRWTKLLTKISGLNPQDFLFVKKLGDDNKEWQPACDLLVQRLVRDLDVYHSSKLLDELRQDCDQSVQAFSEEFAELKGRAMSNPAVDWRSSDLFSHYQFLSKLRPPLRQAVEHDHRRTQIASTFPAVVQLAVSIEREKGSSLFEHQETNGSSKRNHPNSSESESARKKRKRSHQQQQQAHNNSRGTDIDTSTETVATDQSRGVRFDTDSSHKKSDNSTCERCGKSFHSSAKCKSEFHKSGERIPGAPPGQPSTWARSNKTCNKCGSTEHMSFFAGCTANNVGVGRAPAVRSMRLQRQSSGNPCILCGGTDHASYYCKRNPSGPNGSMNPTVRAMHLKAVDKLKSQAEQVAQGSDSEDNSDYGLPEKGQGYWGRTAGDP